MPTAPLREPPTITRLLRLVLGVYILFLGSEEYLAGPGPVFKIAVTLFGVFLVALILGEARIRFSSAGAAMGLYAAFAFLSLIWTVDPERSQHYAIMLVELIITTWITVTCIENERDRKIVTWLLVFMSLFPGVAMAHDKIVGHSAWTLGYLRFALREYGARMTFGDADPNLLAFRFAVSTTAAGYLLLQETRRAYKTILVLLLALFATTSLFTGSRGGVLAMIIALAVVVLMSAKGRLVQAILAITGVTLVLATSLPFLPQSISERYLSMGSEIATGGMAGRKNVYHESLDSFQRSPMLGVGYLAFETASREHGGEGLAAHNDPLQVIVDLGLVGLIFYLGLMGVMLWNALKTPGPWNILSVGLLCAYYVSGSSITLLGTKLPWILFGITLGLRRQGGPGEAAARLSWRHTSPAPGPPKVDE
jgi:O-antigen ligase